MSANGAPQRNGEYVGWTGPAYGDPMIVDVSTVDYPFAVPARTLYCAGAGDVVFILEGGTVSTTRTVAAKSTITGYSIAKIVKSGTTATGMEGYQ